jgi:hypothetical protein
MWYVGVVAFFEVLTRLFLKVLRKITLNPTIYY